MFLSFVIPTYNGEKYLAECLDSLLDQDLPESEYEITCVDDGSSDGTCDVIRSYQNRHSNVILIKQEHRADFPRNVGLFRASGDYIWFVDQDDVLLPNCLSELRQHLLTSGCDRLVFQYYEFVKELSPQEKQRMKDHTIRPNSGAGKENNVVWSSVFKKSFLIDHEVWPHSKRFGKRGAGFGSDGFFIDESREAGAKELVLDDKAYYFYRKHIGQSVYSFSDDMCKARISSYLDYPLVFKEEYDRAMKEKGEISYKQAQNLVVQTRMCAIKMQNLPRKWRKVGMDRMREEGLFPLRLPKVYTDHYSWLDCAKAHNKRRPLLGVSFYYSVNPVGLFFHTLLDVRNYFIIIKNRSPLVRKMILSHLDWENRKNNW